MRETIYNNDLGTILKCSQLHISSDDYDKYCPSKIGNIIYYQNDLIKNKALLYIKFEKSGIDGVTIFALNKQGSTTFYFSSKIVNLVNNDNSSATSMYVGFNSATGTIKTTLTTLANKDDINNYGITSIFYI